MALWSKSASALEAWWYLDDFKRARNRALQNEFRVNDGGIYRLLAGLYVYSTDLKDYDLYDPNLALQYAEKAIEMGPQYLQAYYLKTPPLTQINPH